MKQTSGPAKEPAEAIVKDIRRATRRHFSAEDKIRIMLEGLRGEDSIAELCRREGITSSMYYGWSKEFLEAGKKRLAGDTARAATSDEVKALRREASALKEVVADLTLENRLLKKTTAAKLAVWQTGAIRFAVELEGRDGQTPVKDAGSGTHLTPAAPPVPGVRGRDAHPLREPPHPGDAVRHGACAPEGEALRGQGLCALP